MVQFTENYRKCNDIEVADDQVEGINFLLQRRGAILAYSTGMGKTLTASVAIKILLDASDVARCVLVVPVKAVKAFRRELFNRVGMKKEDVGFLTTEYFDFDLFRNKIFIVTDTNIGKYSGLFTDLVNAGYKTVLVIDEAHKLQNPESAFYKTMIEAKKYCMVSWGLTATPILNNLDSLYHIVDYFVPGFLGEKVQFDNAYTTWHLEDVFIRGGHGKKRKTKVLDGYKHLDILNQKLGDVMIVKQKQYNLKFGNLYKELTPEESKIYERVSSGIMTYGGGKDDARDFTRRLYDLQRFVDRAYDGDEDLKELVEQYSNTLFSTKEQLFLDAVKKTLDLGYSIIVYADIHDTVNRLESVLQHNQRTLGLHRIFKVTGKINITARERVEEQISERDVVLITSAGSESINLQRANCIIFYDIPFSAKTIIQTVGRVCRRDTKHKYQYILTLYTKGTVDEYKYLCFQNNLGMIQQSVGAGSDLPLDSMDVDNKTLQKLKAELLWHYKHTGKKVANAKRKVLKSNIILADTQTCSGVMATSKFLVEPIPCTDSTVKEVPVLYPDVELYTKYKNKLVPLTVIRAKYLEFLQTVKGKALISTIQQKVLDENIVLLLVGDTEIPSILKDEIIQQCDK